MKPFPTRIFVVILLLCFGCAASSHLYEKPTQILDNHKGSCEIIFKGVPSIRCKFNYLKKNEENPADAELLRQLVISVGETRYFIDSKYLKGSDSPVFRSFRVRRNAAKTIVSFSGGIGAGVYNYEICVEEGSEITVEQSQIFTSRKGDVTVPLQRYRIP